MSLINDMLRDLDKRKTAYPQQQGADGVRVTPVANSRDKRFARRWVWLVALVGLIFLAAFGWHLYGEMQTKVMAGTDQFVATHNESENKTSDEVATAVSVGDSADESAGEGTEEGADESIAAPTAIAEPSTVQSSTSSPALSPAPTPVQQAPAFADILGVEVQAIEDGARIEITLSAPVQHRVFRHAQQLIIDLPATRLAEALPNLTRHALIRAVDASAHATGMQLTFDVSEPVALQTSLLSQQQTRLIVELTAIAKAEQLTLDPREQAMPSSNEKSAASPAETPDSTPSATPNATPVNVDSKSSSASFAKTSRQLTLAERDQQANRKALKLMRSGRTQAADQLLQPLLSNYPLAHQSRATLIALKMTAGQLDQAQQLIAQGLQLAPKQLAFIKLKARLLLAQQQPAEAATLLSAQLPQQPQAANDQELLALLASATQRAGQHQRAADIYQQLLAQNNQQPQWWVGLAISLEALKQHNNALNAYLQARDLAGISPALLGYVESRITQLK